MNTRSGRLGLPLCCNVSFDMAGEDGLNVSFDKYVIFKKIAAPGGIVFVTSRCERSGLVGSNEMFYSRIDGNLPLVSPLQEPP